MNTRTIDLVNIGLMLVSCILAFIAPFHLFLFSFAVLGPLHYFTEIPWLSRKQYFATGKYDYLLLVGFCAAIAVVFYTIPKGGVVTQAPMHTMAILGFSAFGSALALTLFRSYWQKAIGVALMVGVGLIGANYNLFTVIFANLITSIIHVWLFTGAFILFGALKNKSTTGIASLVVFGACSVLLLTMTPSPQLDRSLSYYVKTSYLSFGGLNFDLMNTLGLAHVGHNDPGLAELLFESNIGIMVMRLVAFSYTYHFLNWFSKTSVIKWHQISKRGLAIVLGLWVASLVLYSVDYQLGIQYLYVLSMLHVVLEFPLNHRTFIGIGQELKKLVVGKPATA